MRRFIFFLRASSGAVFQTEPARMCYDPYCLHDEGHVHGYGVGDMTAEELLALAPEEWREAYLDLREQYPTEAAARRALRREAEEDDERARDDLGRKVA